MNASSMSLVRQAAESVIPFLFHESVYVTLIFGIVWLISRIVRSRHPLLQTGLWLLVFVRLVLPVDLSQPFSGRNLIAHLFSWKSTEPSLTSEMDALSPIGGNIGSPGDAYLSSPIRADGDLILFGIWLSGVLMLTCLLFMRLNHYRRMIQDGTTIETGHAHEILETWRNRLGIRRRVKLVMVSNAASPFTIGSFRPVVVIPEFLLSDGRHLDLESVIGHETAHVKRWDDLWIKLQNIIQIVYFFNPVVWIAGNRLNLVRECACDSLVLAQKWIDRIRYAHGLINMLKLQPFGPDCVALTPSFSNGRNSLLTRLQNMKGEHHMRTIHKIGTACLLVGLAVVVLPMAAASVPESQKQEKSSITTDQPATSTLRLIMPVEGGQIHSGFGMRKHPITGQNNFHNAVDIPQKKGTPVLAAADGKVVELKSKDFDPKGYGRYIILEHDGGFRTAYAQLDSILIEDGAAVKQGDKIGLVGESGLSKGTHLHFEVRLNGDPVDPEKYIVK